jgi:hypothetical protein
MRPVRHKYLLQGAEPDTRRSGILIMWTQRTRILCPKKSPKIMVIWIWMAWMIAILGSEVHMGE